MQLKIGDKAPLQPDRPRSEEEILASWLDNHNVPIVTIECTTYNHEKYIEDAINGFLIQETKFPFNVIIHDDASSDGTADIVRYYENKYPSIIKGIYQESNLYSKGISRKPYLLPYITGMYVAKCEGDDYWIDPRKLEKQVSFLLLNRDYSISGHDAMVVDDRGIIVGLSKLQGNLKRDFSSDELLKGKAGRVLTLSRVVRRDVYFHDLGDFRFTGCVLNGDNFTTAIAGLYGHGKFHHDICPAVYRQHEGGVWSGLSSRQQKESQAISWYFISKYFDNTGYSAAANSWMLKSQEAALNTIPLSTVLHFYMNKYLRLAKKLSSRLAKKIKVNHLPRRSQS